jgi:hypothetical protein
MVEMNNMIALKTERGESSRNPLLYIPTYLQPIAARDTHDLKANNATRQMAAAVRTADAGIDAGCHQGIPLNAR